MASNISKQTYFLGTLILSVISGLLFLVTEFAWWQELGYGDWYYVRVGGEFSGFFTTLVLIGMAGLFFFQAYISLLGLRYEKTEKSETKEGPVGPSSKQIQFAFSAAILTFAITIVGWIIFEIVIVWAGDWGLGTSFYAGIIGGGLNTFLFRQVNKI